VKLRCNGFTDVTFRGNLSANANNSPAGDGFMLVERENMMKTEHKSKIVLFFLLIGISSFVGGSAAKLIYQLNNDKPEWLNSIVVGFFLGVGFFFMSGGGIISSALYGWRTDKVRAIWSLIVGIPIFLLGLFTLWKVLLDLFALFGIL
jgi:hypothetical protein